MGRGLEALHIVLSIVLLVSGSAAAAALVGRKSAIILATASLSLILFIVIAIFSFNDYSASSVLDAIASYTYPFFIVAASSILCTLSFTFILINKHGHISFGRGRRKYLKHTLFALFIAVLAVATYGITLYQPAEPIDLRTYEMTVRNGTNKLQKIDIHGQQRKVICTNFDVINYIELCLKSDTYNAGKAGIHYITVLSYADGTVCHLRTYWHESESVELVFGHGHQKSDTAHYIKFPKPRPKYFDALTNFLQHPSHRVSGTTLIMTPSGYHTEPDKNIAIP